jgi:hypothetical protein
MRPNSLVVNATLRTDGTSVWCNAGPRDVKIYGMHLQLGDEGDCIWGLLDVYTSESGYEIYTDNGY